MLAKTAGSTFLVYIQYRENASWQGRVQWLEGEQEQNFRSLLELLNLLQGAMEKGGPPGEELREWDSEADRPKKREVLIP